jgi:acyl-CoA thioesterase-2
MAEASEVEEPLLTGLIERLDLEQLDTDLFLGDPGSGTGRLFGGMVAAQSVMAVGRTVPDDRRLHSLHAYFLRPGRHDAPIRFVVDRIRDGGSFTTRRVKAQQAGEAIFNLSASFSVPEEGIAHQDEMPGAPPPEGLPDWEDVRGELMPGAPRMKSPIEVRMADPMSMEPSPPRQRSWMRVRGALPDDPLVHTAVLVYATDRTLLGTATRPHAIPWKERIGVSLDHAVWIHHEVKLDDWLLYTSESPIAQGAHGVIFGAVWYPDGRRLASVAQEGLIRRRRPAG